MRRTCPGLENHVRPKPEFITCPGCGSDVEIWTDEDETECRECGTRVARETESCLDWCDYADECRQIVKELSEVPQ